MCKKFITQFFNFDTIYNASKQLLELYIYFVLAYLIVDGIIYWKWNEYLKHLVDFTRMIPYAALGMLIGHFTVCALDNFVLFRKKN